MKRHFFGSALVVLFVVLTGRDLIRASAPSYTVEDLGTIGGLVPTITGMNASGQLSGWTRSGTIRRAVRYTNDIGWELVPGVHATNSTATAINASGDIAGFHGTPSRAFRYTDAGGVTTLHPLPGGSFAVGLSINAAGVMTGNGDSSAGQRGWRSVPGEPSEIYPEILPTLGGALGMTCGINDKGQIAGSATNADGQQHAYRVDPNADGTGFDVTEVVPLDGVAGLSRACAINASGRVGGNSSDGSVTRAFVSDGGLAVNVDAFGSAQSTVESMAGSFSVGWYVGTAGARAFVHTDANGSADLNGLLEPGSGWILQQAFAVNAAGQIAGVGTLNGVRRAFRLTPTAPPPDTTAPVISAVSATPSTVLPKGQLVDVTVTVTAADDMDPAPVCAVASVSATGGTADDYSFTGLAARVRAVGGRTYTLNVTCADAAGNVSPAFSTDVVVPPDTTAPVISAVSATPSTVLPPKGQVVDVTVAATATDDVDDAPVCAVSSISATGGTADDFSFAGLAARVRAVGGRTYTLSVTCADAAGNVSPASATAVVVPPDTTAPVISAVSATPSTVSPPKGQLVNVAVAVTATDDVDDAPVCAVSSISAAGGSSADDFSFTGLTARVRAVGGTTYTLNVTCVDTAGNAASRSTSVVVPPDTTAPVISYVKATPDAIWPPNGKMVPVTVMVSAYDDVDGAPQCSLTSVTSNGGNAADAVVTGRFTADVRAEKNADGTVRVYNLNVTCADAANNTSAAAATVLLAKDSAEVHAFARGKAKR